MIIANTVKSYTGYIICKCTYSADISATDEELTAYEVYDKNNGEMIEAFDELEEAMDFVEDQQIWDGIICVLPDLRHIERY